ncbi:hypothetical protein [Acidovorax sp. RAC01]|uniref:hypothetical protein n=1 Tax=Acidovorax sp. RAC01 TaxID=1842533 RepID=UPI000858E1A8|nr:hypothetical protein [Acidovorax sp. RAC01]AOG24484.1 hypothetical protein BSY15_3806 [Acidovorax sp. RAC01]AOG25183.1 hypothetical protein BSY15_3728 [Acidovorax sp. RAC01]
MSGIVSSGPAATMSSKDLLDLINEERKAFGEAEVRHNQFVDRCKDELDGEHYKTFVVTNPNATTSEVLELTQDQCILVAMRESKGVRRSVQAKLKAKAAPVALSRMEILKIAMESEQARIEAEAQRDEAVRTKALIGSKREATAMAKASAAVREVKRLTEELGRNAKHATITAVENALGRRLGKQDWVPLRRYCKSNGLQAEKVHDPRWGEATAWPAEAWNAVYGIDLHAIFPDPQAGVH